MLRSLASLIAPPLCGVCAHPCRPSQSVCSRCAAHIHGALPLSLPIPGIDRGWAAAPYEGTARRLVAAMKFGKRLGLVGVAAEAMAASIPDESSGSATIVPVPADPWRARIRGFDPAALIAYELARRQDLAVSHCLTRGHSRRQVGKARADRLTSDLGVRVVAPAPQIALLIDDVATTGATLAACAATLRAAGSQEVLALAFARA